MQYKVPQNVQIEDRVLPFMTVRQLLISAGGGGFAYMVYLSLERQPMEVWLPPVALITALTLAVAFLKIRDIPFIHFVLLVIERFALEKKRSWQNHADSVAAATVPQKKTSTKKPTVSAGKSASIDELVSSLETPPTHV